MTSNQALSEFRETMGNKGREKRLNLECILKPDL